MATLEKRAVVVESALFERYDELNALWTKAEKELTARHLPHDVAFNYYYPCCPDEYQSDPFAKYLGIAKVKGQWRICHGECFVHSDQDISWMPIVECSAYVRVRMTEHLQSLREELVTTSEKFVVQVDKAIAALRGNLPEEPEVPLADLQILIAERKNLNGHSPKK
jgi:hypothetical protein